MFCTKCGNELADNMKFCPKCGAQVSGNTGDVSSGGKSINISLDGMPLKVSFERIKIIKAFFLLLTLAATVFVALGGLLPIVHCEIGAFGYSVGGDWTLFELREKINILEQYDIEGDALTNFKICVWIAIVAYFVSVFFAAKALLALLMGGKRYQITNPVTVSMFWGMGSVVILILLILFTNHMTAEELYGMEFFTITSTGWLLLVMSIANIFIFVNGYLGEGMFREFFSSDDEDDIAKEKVCLVCKTKYVVGNRCPVCGSEAKVR